MPQSHRHALLNSRLRTIGILHSRRQGSRETYAAQIALLESRCIDDLRFAEMSRDLLDRICASFSLPLFEEALRRHPAFLAGAFTSAKPYCSILLLEKAPYPLVVAALRAGMPLATERKLILRILRDDDAAALREITAIIYPKSSGEKVPRVDLETKLDEFCRHCGPCCAPIVASWFEALITEKGPGPLIKALARRFTTQHRSCTLKITAVLTGLGLDLSPLAAKQTDIDPLLLPILAKTGSGHGRLAFRAHGPVKALATHHMGDFFGLTEEPGNAVKPPKIAQTKTGQAA